jgi:hypothetical protein
MLNGSFHKDNIMIQKTKYITIYSTGKNSSHSMLNVTKRLSSPSMEPRNEISIYILRYRFVLTWGKI